MLSRCEDLICRLFKERDGMLRRKSARMAQNHSNNDLPWPELANVSRGATRGNQGAKGTLGDNDERGRATLQLRVQPNVLAVVLNQTSTQAYRLLDSEVQRALKQTKTYWRKARRRQDYDPRADQAHMELHEWLQQLKDKCMAHLELLLQKGDIHGPPYEMPDNLEFTFMRGFLDRQRKSIPHNPRLRSLQSTERLSSVQAGGSSAGIDELEGEDDEGRGSPESGTVDSPLKSPVAAAMFGVGVGGGGGAARESGTLSDLPRRIEASQSSLRQARARLKQARLASREALARFSECTDHERVLEAEVARSEERLDELVSALLIPSLSSLSQQAHNSAGNNNVASAGSSSVPVVASMSGATGGSSALGSDANGYDVAALRALHQQQNARSAYASHTNPHTPTTSTQGGGGSYWSYPARPVSAVSTTTLDLDGGGSGFSEVGMGPAGTSAGTGPAGEGKELEDWGGDELLQSRVASPHRKHPRDWDHSQSHSHHPPSSHHSQHPHQQDPPPRKRLNASQSDATNAAIQTMALVSSMGGGSPHPHSGHHGGQGGLVAPSHAYQGQQWSGFGGEN